MNYPSDEDKAAISWTIIFALLAALCFVLSSCGEARTPAVDPSDPTIVLGSIGATLAWAGGISAAAGLALSLISLFYPPLQPFAVIFRLIGVGGAGVTVTGAAYLWIAQHYWWVLAVAAVAGCAVGWYFWPRIHRLLDKRLKA